MDSEHVWDVPGLNLQEKGLLVFITTKANRRDGMRMWWSQAQIAEQTGCSRETVKRVLRTLERRGFISREPRYFEADGGGTYRGADFITVHLHRMLEATAQADSEPKGGGVPQTGGGVPQTPPPGLSDPTPGSHRPEGWGLTDLAEPGNLTQEGTQEENPGIEPASASPGPAGASRDGGEDQQLPGQTDVLDEVDYEGQDDPGPMTLEDERKRQMDALAALMGGRAA
ncbi:hypothetical protein AS188_00430 [Kocuria flava]|nr:hypothetical protein AS188_00430 [Kocuria flava]